MNRDNDGSEEKVNIEINIRAMLDGFFGGVYPEEFLVFFKAMIDEMKRHKKEKGDSWREGVPYYRYSSMPPALVQRHRDIQLNRLLRKTVDDYFDEEHESFEDIDHLLDIANVCAMLWCRVEVLRDKR